ncbi:tol-pal system protein YbgF [bacterium]|nr:MAG: tol-pal system protein YbgF [bacterium]
MNITKVKYLLITGVCLLWLFTGCATRSEIKQFQQQMDYLTQANAKQQHQLATIDSLLQIQQELIRQLNANQEYNLQMIAEEMRMIENILTDKGYQVSELREKLEAMREELEAPRTTTTDTTDTTAPESRATVNPKKLFETAQLDYNRSKFELAKMEFEQFLGMFPNSALADDAKYYLGECLYAMGKYDEAMNTYLAVKTNYPESELIPSALYNAGICAMKLDNVPRAKELFKELISDYPTAQETAPAKEKLKILGE